MGRITRRQDNGHNRIDIAAKSYREGFPTKEVQLPSKKAGHRKLFWDWGFFQSAGKSMLLRLSLLLSLFLSPQIFAASVSGVSLTFSPSVLTTGEITTVSWRSVNATECNLTGGLVSRLPVGPAGSTDFSTSLPYSGNYTLSCSNGTSTRTASARLSVEEVKVVSGVSIAFSPSTIVEGASTSVSWNSTNAEKCEINGGPLRNYVVSGSGSTSFQPARSYSGSYTITCSNASSSSASTARLTVSERPVSNVELSFSSDSVSVGQRVNLQWSSSNALECKLTGGGFSQSGVPAFGSRSLIATLSSAGTYTVTCTNNVSTGSANTQLTVKQPVPAVPSALTVVNSSSPDTAIFVHETFALSWPSVSGASFYRVFENTSELSTETGTSKSFLKTEPQKIEYRVAACNPTGCSDRSQMIEVIILATDTDRDGIPDFQDTDDDNDGMSDVCEITHGFSPLNANDGGDTDTDGDGVTNAEECQIGSDPNSFDEPVLDLIGFDEDYKIFGRAGTNDLYITRDGFDGNNAGVGGFYLVENLGAGSHHFNLSYPVTDSQAIAEGFNLSIALPVKQSLADINQDASTDLFLTDIDFEGESVAIIVYAGLNTGAPPRGFKEVDEDFASFVKDTHAFISDTEYFSRDPEYKVTESYYLSWVSDYVPIDFLIASCVSRRGFQIDLKKGIQSDRVIDPETGEVTFPNGFTTEGGQAGSHVFCIKVEEDTSRFNVDAYSLRYSQLRYFLQEEVSRPSSMTGILSVLTRILGVDHGIDDEADVVNTINVISQIYFAIPVEQELDPPKHRNRVELLFTKIVGKFRHAYVQVTTPSGDKYVTRAGPTEKYIPPSFGNIDAESAVNPVSDAEF